MFCLLLCFSLSLCVFYSVCAFVVVFVFAFVCLFVVVCLRACFLVCDVACVCCDLVVVFWCLFACV